MLYPMSPVSTSLDWDDLRYVLAVARAGSAIAAASQLGVNASTVQRRIAGFESANGIHLFERRRRGLYPTAQCRALILEAEAIDERVASLRRDILGSDARLEGLLRLTTTESFLANVIARELAVFKRLHPAIEIQVTVTNTRLSLLRQDADVTIRPSMSPPDTLVGHRASGLAFAAYARADVCQDLPAKPALDDLKNLPWLGIAGELAASPPAKWMAAEIDPVARILTLDSFAALTNCVREGVGIGMLPCSIGDEIDDLIRIDIPGEKMRTFLWLLTHAEVRHSGRIRAFMDHFAKVLRQNRNLFEGRSINERPGGAIPLEQFVRARQS